MKRKELNEMNSLELKGVIFEFNDEIGKIQNHVQNNIVPLLNKKLQEEKEEANTDTDTGK